jgi:hypothetical protein
MQSEKQSGRNVPMRTPKTARRINATLAAYCAHPDAVARGVRVLEKLAKEQALREHVRSRVGHVWTEADAAIVEQGGKG